MHPVDAGALAGPSIYLPSYSRSMRLLQQAFYLSRYRNTLSGFSSYGVLVALFRFPLFFAGFPNAMLAALPKIYFRVR